MEPLKPLTKSTQSDFIYVGEKWTWVNDEASQMQSEKSSRRKSISRRPKTFSHSALFPSAIPENTEVFFPNQLFKNFNSLCHPNRMKSESSSSSICRVAEATFSNFHYVCAAVSDSGSGVDVGVDACVITPSSI